MTELPYYKLPYPLLFLSEVHYELPRALARGCGCVVRGRVDRGREARERGVAELVLHAWQHGPPFMRSQGCGQACARSAASECACCSKV